MAKEDNKSAKDRQAFILRVSPELLKAVEKWAADDFRSVNGQIEFLLHEALKKSGRMKKRIEE
ncbi:MAG TPA: Arc family DNA-binding protein [Chitinophagales bacterium]|nr:Arc family DNA-binding protein [Chitinophagales bacterium]HMU69464.1 Arc family DNA-binding protein [Chitinophagales bacterium]HMX03752.1 Arc family DNA-binding protein [Chitinophagales bacterium]HMZ90147.1 Arc family DNA-binding protein [Chitinophagales bacterium]HNA56879.1 Arc family DNA-binding protein [Chitinophagales bacterium]